jgi:hypothetical protein
MPGSGSSSSTTSRIPAGPAFTASALGPEEPIAACVGVASVWKCAASTSSGVAAGGRSDSWSSALTIVTAASSVWSSAVAFHPPGGSTALRQGGASSTRCSVVPLGRSTVAV